MKGYTQMGMYRNFNGNGGGFDPSKDKEIEHIADVELDEKSWIRVRVMQYNGGEMKVDLRKMGNKVDGSEWFDTKIGRLPEDCLDSLSVALSNAQSCIEAYRTRGKKVMRSGKVKKGSKGRR